MRGATKASCGIYCLRDPRNRAGPRPSLRGYSAPGNPPTCAGLRPSRLLQDYLTTVWCSAAAGFSRLAPQSTQSRTWLLPRAVPAHRHPESLQWSIHHLLVRRANCQLGCLDVWQKRHARTPIAPPNSVFVCPAAPACASAALLYAATAAFSRAVWKSAPLGCTPVRVLSRD